MFLKLPVIIIIRFGENNVLGPIFIDMSLFRGWVHGLLYISRFLFIKTEKLQVVLVLTYHKLEFYT